MSWRPQGVHRLFQASWRLAKTCLSPGRCTAPDAKPPNKFSLQKRPFGRTPSPLPSHQNALACVPPCTNSSTNNFSASRLLHVSVTTYSKSREKTVSHHRPLYCANGTLRLCSTETPGLAISARCVHGLDPKAPSAFFQKRTELSPVMRHALNTLAIYHLSCCALLSMSRRLFTS